MADLKKFLTTSEDGPQKALEVAFSYGQIDGSHHKTWTIDQMVRALTGENYDDFINFYRFTADDEGSEVPSEENVDFDGQDEHDEDPDEREEIYSWDEGGAP